MSNETIRETLNRADPNVLADIFRGLKIGNILKALPTYLRKSTTAVGASVAVTGRITSKQQLNTPAASLLSAYARAGTGTPAILTLVAGVPAAGQCAIEANGQIVTAAADVWTDLDVAYVPEKGDYVELDYAVVPGTGICTLPTNITTMGVVLLLGANVTAGTSTGEKIVLTPGAVNPAAGSVRMNTAKTLVYFTVADAVSMVHLRLLVCSTEAVAAILAADSTVV